MFCTIEANYSILTDTKHRAASLRQHSYLLRIICMTVATLMSFISRCIRFESHCRICLLNNEYRGCSRTCAV